MLSASLRPVRIWLACAPALSRQPLAEGSGWLCLTVGGGSHFHMWSKTWLFGTYLELAPHLMVKLILFFLPGCLKAVTCLLLLPIAAIAVLLASTSTGTCPSGIEVLARTCFPEEASHCSSVLSAPGHR